MQSFEQKDLDSDRYISKFYRCASTLCPSRSLKSIANNTAGNENVRPLNSLVIYPALPAPEVVARTPQPPKGVLKVHSNATDKSFEAIGNGSNIGRRRANAISLVNSPARRGHRAEMARLFREAQATLTFQDGSMPIDYSSKRLFITSEGRAAAPQVKKKIPFVANADCAGSLCLPSNTAIWKHDSENADTSLGRFKTIASSKRPGKVQKGSPETRIPARPARLHVSSQRNQVMRGSFNRPLSASGDSGVALRMEDEEIGDWSGDELYYRPSLPEPHHHCQIETWLKGIEDELPPPSDTGNRQSCENAPLVEDQCETEDDSRFDRVIATATWPELNSPSRGIGKAASPYRGSMFTPKPLKVKMFSHSAAAVQTRFSPTRFKPARLNSPPARRAGIELARVPILDFRDKVEAAANSVSVLSSQGSSALDSPPWEEDEIQSIRSGDDNATDGLGTELVPRYSIGLDGEVEEGIMPLTPEVERFRKGKGNEPRRKRCVSYYDKDILPAHVTEGRT